jgi:hypothetical protein
MFLFQAPNTKEFSSLTHTSTCVKITLLQIVEVCKTSSKNHYSVKDYKKLNWNLYITKQEIIIFLFKNRNPNSAVDLENKNIRSKFINITENCETGKTCHILCQDSALKS